MVGMWVGEAVGTRRSTPGWAELRAQLPLGAGKPAAKGQRTCDIAPPLSKTCVFDLTRGRVVREDQCRQTIDRPRSAGTWRPPTGRSFVFLGLDVPHCRAPAATPRTALPSDPETGPLVNPTCTGKVKLFASIFASKFIRAGWAPRAA